MTYHDVKAAYKKLTAAGVDALIFPTVISARRRLWAGWRRI